jgi:hypothetical protein
MSKHPALLKKAVFPYSAARTASQVPLPDKNEINPLGIC